MFQHILLPVDGSLTATPVVRKCLLWAREAGAIVSALHVMPDTGMAENTGLNDTVGEPSSAAALHAKRILEAVELEARELGVTCSGHIVRHDDPYQAIIDFANSNGCDLICMASHGRKGDSARLLGSETQKVLTHCQLPVLVLR